MADNLLEQIKLTQALLESPQSISPKTLKHVENHLHVLVVMHHALNHSDDIDF